MVSATTVAQQALREGWKVYRFDQIAQNVNERVDDPSQAGVDRYVGLEHLDPESLHIRRWGIPSDVEATKLRFWPGDIIFGRRRAYQRKLAVAEFEGICSAHAMVLRAREDVVLPEFLPFFLQSNLFFERALSISVGSLSPTINWKALAREEFALPTKGEQRRIAKILWAVDEVVVSWEQIAQIHAGLRRNFCEEVLCSGRFERRRLAEAIRSITAGRSLVGVDRPADDREKGVLKVSAVGPRGFDPFENKALIDQSGFDDRYAVRNGDLLMTRSNTRELVGRVCLVDRDYTNLMLSDKTLRLDLNLRRSRPLFLFETLRTTEVRQQIEAQATGTGGAMKNISQEKIRNLRVPLPDVSVQIDLEDAITQLNQVEGSVRLHAQSTRQLLASLSEDLLRR